MTKVHGITTKKTRSGSICSFLPMARCQPKRMQASNRQPRGNTYIALQPKKYAYHLPICPTGGQVYPKVFFGFMEPPDKIMENIGWWLRSTEQGMWKAQLQQVEETTGLGWLLFLADEFDKEALKV